jgi:hypothetical protein
LISVVTIYELFLARRTLHPATPVELAPRPVQAERVQAATLAAPRPPASRENTLPPPTFPRATVAPASTPAKRSSETEKDEPIPFPAKLEQKYLQKAMLENVQRAFQEAGIKPDESAADCTEYPCIVCTSVNEADFSGEELDKLQNAHALDVYKDAESAACIRVPRHDANGANIRPPASCLSFRPKDDAQAPDERTERRLDKRMVDLCSGI